MEKEEKKKLLSLKNLHVNFKVRGRTLTAIRGVDLDIYDGESIAIVGESGSGKSVLTKTFSGMLDSNGYISEGSIEYFDDELAITNVKKTLFNRCIYSIFNKRLNSFSKYEYGSDIYNQILKTKDEIKSEKILSFEKEEVYNAKLVEIQYQSADAYNKSLALDNKNEKDKLEIISLKQKIKDLKNEKKEIIELRKKEIKEHQKQYKENKELQNEFKQKLSTLKEEYKKKIDIEVEKEKIERNEWISKELVLSIGRYPIRRKIKAMISILKIFKDALKRGVDISNVEILDELYSEVAFRVEYRGETNYEYNEEGKKKPFLDEDGKKSIPMWNGYCKLDLAKFKLNSDWQQIRGARVATIFQDPMTSLNPIITIGKQITDCILKHQNLTYEESKKKALELMSLVGINNPEERFDDYPFQYSGGMRQRIVIAIALSCQPKILICDEPTTALDVTIQAQIIRLIKDLQKKLGFTIVFITHDLGVVANVADRVAVLYAGQVVEIGNVDEIFYDPKHPYTWSLLSSLPQLSTRGEELFSIQGTPPSLYNKIVGDPFAPRNPYRMAIDFKKEPPMFKVSETHYAKTWLLDSRAPKTEKPEIIQNIHEKLSKTIYSAENFFETDKIFDEIKKENEEERQNQNLSNDDNLNSLENSSNENESTETIKEEKVEESISLDNAKEFDDKKEPIISLQNVDITFGKNKVVNNATFDIFKGETFSLVGESGSGKTTIGRAIVRINPVSNGAIYFKGKKISGKLSRKEDREVIRNIQMVFQDPAASLNERATIEYIVSEGLSNFKLYENDKEKVKKVEDIINEVGLLPEHLTRYPHEFSGGQRQRVGLARSIVMEPEFVIADEPISALDVSIRAQILNLLKKFQKEDNITYLFIAHDLSIVRFISDRIGVIYKGDIVEIAEAEELFNYPLHPYTKSLLSAIPVPDPEIEKNKNLYVYDPSIHDYSIDKPTLQDIGNNHFVFCNKKEFEKYVELRNK